jgi:OOP family OmpA-OmpF porin
MNWQRWVRPGLVLTFLLSAAALLVRSGAVEEDLETRVAAALVAQGQGWAEVEAAWRTVVISGIAPSERAQSLTADLATEVRGVKGVSNRSQLLPEQSPYFWSAEKAGMVITITGSVASEGARGALLAEARRVFPSNEIREELNLARGTPDVYAVATGFALARLAELQVGLVTLTDSTLVVTGTALDADALTEARRAFDSRVPNGVTMGPIEVLPSRASRFVWSASADAGRVLLAGFIPNDAVRDIIAAQVRDAFPNSEINDSSIVASGEPEGFLDAVEFAVRTMVRLENGGVTLDGLVMDIAGSAKSVDDYDALLKSVEEDLPTGMTVLAADVIPAVVADYGFRGTVSAAGVELVGYVGSMQERNDLAVLIKSVFGANVANTSIRVARGGPRIDWIGAVEFAVGELARLQEGTVSIGADATYLIDGVARSSREYAAISEAVATALPASMSLAGNSVRPPEMSPYRFAAFRQGDTIVISGYAGDRQEHRMLLDLVQRTFGGLRIEDRTEFAGAVPVGFWEATDSGLRALSRMAGGGVALVDTTLDLNGAVHFRAAKSHIEDVLWERLPNDFTATSNVTVRQAGLPLSPEDCGDKLQAVLVRAKLVFQDNADDLAGRSRGSLDQIAAIVKRCPDTVIEIGVHSDSDGRKSANRRRTTARAEVLLELMVEAQVRRERLTAVGYGESDPLASNATAEGKAANRRIEFALAVPEPPPEPEPPAEPEPAPEPEAIPAPSQDEKPAPEDDLSKNEPVDTAEPVVTEVAPSTQPDPDDKVGDETAPAGDDDGIAEEVAEDPNIEKPSQTR